MELAPDVALIVIDVQDAINEPDRSPRNNPQAEEKIAGLLAAWREADRPLFHIKDCPVDETSRFHRSKPGNEIQEFARPLDGEPLIEKAGHSAFVGTDLEQRLRESGISTLVMVGFVTNHCVESTARMAANLGFQIFVVADATAAFALEGVKGEIFDSDLVHNVSLANMRSEFATVVESDEVFAAVISRAAVIR